MTPRSMSWMNDVPAQPAENTAVMTTTPGVRYSRYDVVPKPGRSARRVNSCPNSSSHTIGWTRLNARYMGCRASVRSARTVR